MFAKIASNDRRYALTGRKYIPKKRAYKCYIEIR
jgi:hypothetical protein